MPPPKRLKPSFTSPFMAAMALVSLKRILCLALLLLLCALCPATESNIEGLSDGASIDDLANVEASQVEAKAREGLNMVSM